MGTGAGIGLAARAEERGGADLIIVYGTGKYRMAGRSSMAGRFAFGNANDLVLKMAQEVMPVAPHTPVLAGVFIQDPFRDMMGFIEQLKQAGYSGVQNVPGMGGMDQMEGARTVTSLDAAGIRHGDGTGVPAGRKGPRMVTTPYAYNLTQAVQLAANGSDMLCLHVGLTTKGLTAAQVAPPIERCAQMLSSWIEAIRAENPDTIILCHGGPIAEPQDFSYIMRHVEGHFRLLRRVVNRAHPGGKSTGGCHVPVPHAAYRAPPGCRVAVRVRPAPKTTKRNAVSSFFYSTKSASFQKMNSPGPEGPLRRIAHKTAKPPLLVSFYAPRTF